jgi:epoxyqueuosine reductase QueG
MIVDQILEIAQEEHIPVFGVGFAAAMAGEQAGHRPEDLLPGAQSLICFGHPVPQGVYRMPHRAVTAKEIAMQKADVAS